MDTYSPYFPVKQEQVDPYMMQPTPYNGSMMQSPMCNGPMMQPHLGNGPPMQMQMGNGGPMPTQMGSGATMPSPVANGTAKKPRKKAVKKEKTEPGMPMLPMENGQFPVDTQDLKQEKITDHMKVRKKRDRFKGMSEEEVLKRVLPDHLAHDLDIIIVGINPGLTAAFVGHHYAGPGNHFWKCLFLSGLIPEQMNAYQDVKLLEYGIGFTNIVERTSRGSADLSRKEIKEGGEILKTKIQKYKPKIAVFNGKGIYEVFCGHKNFSFGKQPEPFPDTDAVIYVMPSSSARCTQLPRAIDKVPFYNALRKLRDHLRGRLPDLDPAEIVFPDVFLKTAVKVKPEVKDEPTEGKQNAANDANLESQPPKKKRGRKPGFKVKKEVPSAGDFSSLSSMPSSLPQGNGPSETLGSLTQGSSWLQAIPNISETMSNSSQSMPLDSNHPMNTPQSSSHPMNAPQGSNHPMNAPQGLFQPQFDIQTNGSRVNASNYSPSQGYGMFSNGNISQENGQNGGQNMAAATVTTGSPNWPQPSPEFYSQASYNNMQGQVNYSQPWQTLNPGFNQPQQMNSQTQYYPIPNMPVKQEPGLNQNGGQCYFSQADQQ